MKTLENIGEWVLDTGWMWMVCVLLVAIFSMCMYSSSHSVAILDSQFECTATDAVGIKARCTQYTMKELPRSLANREE